MNEHDETESRSAASKSAVRRIVMRLSPICYVHHICYGYGFVLAPILPWTIGYFRLSAYTRRGRFRGGVCFVKIKNFHNCTWSGVY